MFGLHSLLTLKHSSKQLWISIIETETLKRAVEKCHHLRGWHGRGTESRNSRPARCWQCRKCGIEKAKSGTKEVDHGNTRLLYFLTQALKQRVVCFSKLRPAPLHRCGSRWSDRGLVGFVPVQRLETWTAFDPGSRPWKGPNFSKSGPGWTLPFFFSCFFNGFVLVPRFSLNAPGSGWHVYIHLEFSENLIFFRMINDVRYRYLLKSTSRIPMPITEVGEAGQVTTSTPFFGVKRTHFRLGPTLPFPTFFHVFSTASSVSPGFDF